jgi:5-methyltetrahydrofolate--homocysteine methyltransferase
MAKTAQRKLEVANAFTTSPSTSTDSKPEDLVFDDLTFTLATGDAEFVDSAKETIEGIRLIKTKLPGVMTSLGVSNLSFGLAHKRARIELGHALSLRASGLDMAIVNAAHVMPYAEIGPKNANSAKT